MVVNEFIDSLKLDEVVRMAGDMSPRKYFRGLKGGRSSVIMCYPDADEKVRAELRTFIKITEFLAGQGVKVPALLALDEALVCAQFEDLGDKSFGDLRRAGEEMAPYYTLATDVLKAIKDAPCPDFLPAYHEGHIHYKRRQLVQYYLPVAAGRNYTQEQMESYLAAWEEIEKYLPPCPQGFLHVDYHLENLMWCPDEQGIRRCGLIDYQDAVCGPLPYDLLNLLEDARVDVPPELKAAMIERYCDDFDAGQKEAFRGWYDVLAAQFHSRVTGLFIMQAVENGRDDYLPHMPRMFKYMRSALEKPVMAPLKRWCAQERLDFASAKDLNGEYIRNIFASLKG